MNFQKVVNGLALVAFLLCFIFHDNIKSWWLSPIGDVSVWDKDTSSSKVSAKVVEVEDPARNSKPVDLGWCKAVMSGTTRIGNDENGLEAMTFVLPGFFDEEANWRPAIIPSERSDKPPYFQIVYQNCNLKDTMVHVWSERVPFTPTTIYYVATDDKLTGPEAYDVYLSGHPPSK